MRRIIQNATAVRGVEAGSTATYVLANEPYALHAVEFVYKKDGDRATQAEIIADIESIEMLINGVVQRQHQMDRLFKIERENGFKFTAGRIPIRFSQSERETIIGQDRTSLILTNLPEVSFRIKFAAAATGFLTLEPLLFVTNLTNAQLNSGRIQGPLITHRDRQVQVTGAEVTRYTYQVEPNRALTKIRAFSNNIRGVRVFLGENILYEIPDLVGHNALLEDQGYVPQDGMLTLGGEMFTGRLDDALVVNRERTLRFDFDMTAPGTFDLLFEELGTEIN